MLTYPISFSRTINTSTRTLAASTRSLSNTLLQLSNSSSSLRSTRTQFHTPIIRSFSTTRFTSFNHSTAKMGVHDIGNQEDFKKALSDAGDNVVVVDFFATWCGPCKVISPKVVQMSNDPKYSKVTFIKIDVDQVPEVAQEYGIRAMPTFKYFKNQEEVDDVVGANPQAIVQKLDKLI